MASSWKDDAGQQEKSCTMGDKGKKDKDKRQKQKKNKEEKKIKKKQETKPNEIPWQKGK